MVLQYYAAQVVKQGDPAIEPPAGFDGKLQVMPPSRRPSEHVPCFMDTAQGATAAYAQLTCLWLDRQHMWHCDLQCLMG